MRTLTTNEKAIVRRVALNVDVFKQKTTKINKRISDLELEKQSISDIIESMEKPIVEMTGLKSSDFYWKDYVTKNGKSTHEWKFENKEF